MWKSGELCSDKVFHKIQDFSTHKSTALLLARRCKLLAVHAFISPTRSGVSGEINEPAPVDLCLVVELAIKGWACDEACPSGNLWWHISLLSSLTEVYRDVQDHGDLCPSSPEWPVGSKAVCRALTHAHTHVQSASAVLALPPQETS